MEQLYRYGYIVDEDHLLDTHTIPNHTISYKRKDGLWQATLELWVNCDPGDWVDVYSSARQKNIHECWLEIKEGSSS